MPWFEDPVRRVGTVLWGAAVALSGCGEQPAGPSSPEGAPRGAAPAVPGELIAEVSDGWTLAQIEWTWGTETLSTIPGSAFALLEVPAGQTFETFQLELLLTGACTTCEPNYVVSSPEAQEGSIAFYEGDLTGDDVADQDAMKRVRAQVRAANKGKGITIAILDTGIDASHPALASQVRTDGWDFVGFDEDPHDEADGLDQDLDGITDEGAGHGTHVAGIVNFLAPKASLLPVRVLDSEGNGTIFGLAQGIDFATTAGAEVINMSLALNEHSTVAAWTLDAAHAAGTLCLASAGNDGVESDMHFPASHPTVMGIAALDASDLKASFSNYGSIVSISAPGTGIVSTYLFGGYAVWSGTSMATSFVSGAAALAYKAFPAFTPDEIRARIEARAVVLDHSGQPYDGLMGAGRLDVAGTVMSDPEW